MTDVPNTAAGATEAVNLFENRPIQYAPTTGSISIIRINENNVISTVISDAGTVDYAKGEIILYPINITSTSLENRIEIKQLGLKRPKRIFISSNTTGTDTQRDLITSGSYDSQQLHLPSSFTRKFTR